MSESLEQRARRMLEEGKHKNEVARELGVSRQWVWSLTSEKGQQARMKRRHENMTPKQIRQGKEYRRNYARALRTAAKLEVPVGEVWATMKGEG